MKYLKGFIIALVALSSVACAKGNWKNAQEAYTKVCAYCHNFGVGPDSVKIVFDKDSINARAESIVYVVRHGLNAMPAFRKTEIDDATLRKLAEGLAKGKIK
ncbi:MAG: p-cresol methylhydroxylase [Proteobacteria bacterium]|nr:MAG: p-cresol methylhydroxylase [Pseudomonadota bacterium]